MKTIIGIDPGQKGGIACIVPFKQEYETDITQYILSMPVAGKEINVDVIHQWLLDRLPPQPTVAYIEKVHAMPQQGVSSTFKFGFNVGILHGIIRTMEIPLKLVTPQAWKKVVLAGTDKSKEAAIDHCVRTYPKVSLLATERSRKPHDGMADALCIAEYGWKQEN